MIRVKQFIVWFVFLSVNSGMLIGCDKEEKDEATTDRVPVELQADIISTTRAVNNEWGRNDAIGLTMFMSGSYKIADNTSNYGYKISSVNLGSFAPMNSLKKAYYLASGENVDIFLYYPYTSSAIIDDNELIIPLSVSNQTSLANIDFMTAHAVGKNQNDPFEKFVFNHALSQLNFIIKTESEEESDRMKGAKLIIKKIPVNGNYDIKKQMVNLGASTGEIKVPLQEEEKQLAGQAIILPGTKNVIVFNLTLANGYIYNLDLLLTGNKVFEAGKSYTFNVTLRQFEMPSTLVAEVGEWGNGGSYEHIFY